MTEELEQKILQLWSYGWTIGDIWYQTEATVEEILKITDTKETN